MIMSLRARLILIILLPLLLIASIIGYWAVQDAQVRAEERFDRSLLSAVLAISRDVAVSNGDALSPETNALLRDTAGGPVFYHAFAPDGVFITGYATPPVPINLPDLGKNEQFFYDGTYLNQPVRALKFVDVISIDGLSGNFTFTVWQNTVLRSAIVRDLSLRTFGIIATLVITVALVVWFGVGFGLRPLNDLEAAIARRSSKELDPIKRKAPVETKGIVDTLNQLLQQLALTIRAKDEFISNAAHQLRNPIAGVASMSEAVHSAKSFKDAKERSAELVIASRKASELAHKLLALERATSDGIEEAFERFNLTDLMVGLTQSYERVFKGQGVEFTTDLTSQPTFVFGDKTLISEAITNLLDNTLRHGGPDLSCVSVTMTSAKGHAIITIEDDGKGLSEHDIPKAMERFGQVRPTQGSGLGLSIADTATSRHSGTLELVSKSSGLLVRVSLPRAA